MRLTNARWQEEGLGALKALIADGDDSSVGQLVGFFEGGRRGSNGHLWLEVEGDVAELLLDVTDDLTLSRGGEGVSSQVEEEHEVVREVATGHARWQAGVRQGVTLVIAEWAR